MIHNGVEDTRHFKIHQSDVISTIEKLKASQGKHYDASYFFNLAIEFCLEKQQIEKRPIISIMGLTFPEEIIYAFGAQPLWILGGSFGSALYADRFVPRDTDSVTKASLGCIRGGMTPYNDDPDLLIVPITTDSMRKVAHMLSKEVEVFPVDVPPIKSDRYSKKKWMYQINSLIQVLEKKTKMRLSYKRLYDASMMVNAAKTEMQRLLYYSTSSSGFIPVSLVMFIINTYYFAPNILEWTQKLMILNDKFKSWKTRNIDGSAFFAHSVKPSIIIAGSPIYFPNFKIPLLFDEYNVHVAAYVNEMTRRAYSKTEIFGMKVGLDKLLEIVAHTHYMEDSSPSFPHNTSRMKFITDAAKNNVIDGAIYHVLKGQIDYDFDLIYLEEYFSANKIPAFRLETDYNYQDIEQLRIRTEAFIEMISAKYENHINSNSEKMRA